MATRHLTADRQKPSSSSSSSSSSNNKSSSNKRTVPKFMMDVDPMNYA